MKEKIERWYRQGLWTAALVQNAVEKGVLTQAECAAILGGLAAD